MSKSFASVNVGESLALNATNDSILDISYKWASSDNSVASVTKDGKVYGNKAGSATITVKSENGVTASCKVTVQPPESNPEGGEVRQSGASSNNASANDYYSWSSVIKSNLTENSDKTLTRVESTSNGVLVENYSAGGKTLLSKSTIKNELPIYGGYFSGENNNYIVFGQNNKNENNSAEIIRIVKYSKNWSRISDCKIYGSNTTAPFNAGSLRMIELDGKLYVYTCHEMYADSNNLNHQANMLFTVDESTMKTTDSMYEVSNLQNGYVSHSFNQFIATDGAYIYRVDHSESNEMTMQGKYLSVNGITLSKYIKSASSTNVAVTVPVKFDIHSGNYTGATIGGFEVGSGNCIIAYTKDISSSCKSRNAYISVTDKYFNKTINVALTRYKSGSAVTCRTTHLVKINENLFLVLWEEYNSSTKAVTTKVKTIDSSANVISSATLPVRLSDCKPVLCSDGTVKWYVSENSAPILYSVNPYDLSNRHKHNYTCAVTRQPTCSASGIKTYTCTTCGDEWTESISKLAHTYKQSLTPAAIGKNGKIVKKCSACGATITSSIAKISTVSLSAVNYTYNGGVKTPSVTVKDSKGRKLSNGRDYTVTYPSGRKNVGRYSVKIRFKGNYSGTKTLTYNINPKGTSMSKVTAAKKGFKAKWKKQSTQTTGYQLQYSTSSKFKKGTKTVNISKNKTTSKSVRKLYAKKKYYVRVRTYKTVKFGGKNIKLYSGWSKAKAVKTKK